MDPLGLSLELFEPIGRLRTKYENKQTVTSHGTYKGDDFQDIEGLKEIMLRDIRPFAYNPTVRLAEYAKGRKLSASDFVLIEDIVNQHAATDFPLATS